MHPLIQSYAKKIGRDRYDELSARGEKLACLHFMLRLAKNANIYWSKDTCKDSPVLFKKTRTISNIFFKFTPEAGKNKIKRS